MDNASRACIRTGRKKGETREFAGSGREDFAVQQGTGEAGRIARGERSWNAADAEEKNNQAFDPEPMGRARSQQRRTKRRGTGAFSISDPGDRTEGSVGRPFACTRALSRHEWEELRSKDPDRYVPVLRAASLSWWSVEVSIVPSSRVCSCVRKDRMQRATGLSLRLARDEARRKTSLRLAMVSNRPSKNDPEGLTSRVLEDLVWERTFVQETPGETIDSDVDVTRPRNVVGALWSPAVLTRPSEEVQEPSNAALTNGTARCISFSEDVVSLLGSDPSYLSDVDERNRLAESLVGCRPLPSGAFPYAACYGGHQFGNWAGQLGDGRAVTLGESLSSDGKRWELQVKGPGRTAYSRMADGRAVLRSSIREYLMSEAMHSLGVPTTRALALVETGAKVLRDIMYSGDPRWEPGAIVCRVAPTWMRFGTFQLPASRGEFQLVKVAADYLAKYHMKDKADLPPGTKYAAMLEEIVVRTAALVVEWCSVGFTHGVLNTDNMSVLGLTLDYGPFGTVEEFDPSFTPNTTDLPGRRYCFGNQPDVALWNLARMAEAWVQADLVSLDQAKESISLFPEEFRMLYEKKFATKLGLQKTFSRELLDELTLLMAEDKADYNCTFRALSKLNMEDCPGRKDQWIETLVQGGALLSSQMSKDRKEKWILFLHKYSSLVNQEDPSFLEKRAKQMEAVNPVYILRNHLLQTAIDQAEKGDYAEVHKLLDICRHPYQERSDLDLRYARRAPPGTKKVGVTMLSCSS